jgi:hypothetical protein
MEQERVQKIWEWAGFKWNNRIELWDDPIDGLISSILPPLTLDNLFKYVMPKLKAVSLLWDGRTYDIAVVNNGEESGAFVNLDPAEALAEAIEKVINA